MMVAGSRTLRTSQFDPTSGRVLSREPLFPIPETYIAARGNDFYDVSADGERFLMARAYTGASGETEPPGFILIQNFFEELRQRMGGN